MEKKKLIFLEFICFPGTFKNSRLKFYTQIKKSRLSNSSSFIFLLFCGRNFGTKSKLNKEAV